MTTSLNNILRSVDANSTLVHLGPGILYDTIDYSLFEGSVVIVEPDPDWSLFFSSLYSTSEKVRVIDAAVVAQEKPTTLQKYDFRLFNSLQLDRESLRGRFPNLQQSVSVVVHTLDPPQLGKVLLKYAETKSDILLLDRFGGTIELLDALDGEGLLNRFHTIVVRTLREKSCDANNDVNAVTGWFEERFFDGAVHLEDQESYFNLLLFSKNEEARTLSKLETAILDRDNEIASLIAQESAAKADLEDLQHQFSELKEKHDERLNVLARIDANLALINEMVRNDMVDDEEQDKPSDQDSASETPQAETD